MNEEKGLPKWIAIAAAITTLSVPFMYILGYAYDQGYLDAYGINSQFFPRSVQEYLVFSFFACFSIATSTVDFFLKNQQMFLCLALIIGGMALAVVFVEKNHLVKRIQNKSEFIKKHWLFDYIFFPFLSAIFAYATPFLLVFAISIILLVPVVSYLKGQNMAEKEIATAKTCTYSTSPSEECVYLIENNKPIVMGKFVSRSPTHLALFNQGKTFIYPVKDQLVEVVPAPKKTAIVLKQTAP